MNIRCRLWGILALSIFCMEMSAQEGRYCIRATRLEYSGSNSGMCGAASNRNMWLTVKYQTGKEPSYDLMPGSLTFSTHYRPVNFHMCVSVSRESYPWLFFIDPNLGVTDYFLSRSDADNCSPDQPYTSGMGSFDLKAEAQKKTGLCKRKISGKYRITVDDPIEIKNVYFRKNNEKNSSDSGCEGEDEIVIELSAFCNLKGNNKLQIYDQKAKVWKDLSYLLF
ncbi:MAG: hypothetical protein LBF89_07050 [Bacteroidales bacterium]|jgi:hypothetical protein|nr:hypothetical protein [Bacteroidales bacterium]